MAQDATGGNRYAIAAGVVAAIGVGIFALAQRNGVEAPAAVAPAEVPLAVPGVAGSEAQVAGREPQAASSEAAASGGEPDAAPVAPSFDVVRVAPDGAALVAGRAAPGAQVTVRAGGEAVAEVVAGPGGDFVAIFQAPASDAPQALSLESDGQTGGASSRETVLLLPPAPVSDAPAETVMAAEDAGRAEGGTEGWVPATSADRAAIVEDGTGAAEPEPPAAPVAGSGTGDGAGAGAGEPDVAVAAILREDTVEVLEVPRPGAPRRVSLASIAYGDEGAVTLAGFAPAGSRVRVYVDGAHAGDGAVDDGGRWQLELGEIAAGVYRLRIDEIGSDGRVASRVETPFQRDFPDLAAAPVPGEASVTVQPGNNLWTIARQHYGQGVLYTQIFTANAELIRDPALIYPGQIFVLPAVEGAGPLPVEGPLARP